MKWNGTGRGFKALAVSLAVGLGMTACSRDYTLGYLYVTSATRTTTGEVNGYAFDYQTGALNQLADSPVPSGGSNPVTLVATPNGAPTAIANKVVYVVNHDTSTVVQFAVGTDGKLYAQNTYNVVKNAAGTIVGSFPTWAAVDPTGTFLYVTFTFQNGFTTASPGAGGIAVFPISATDGSLGTPVSNTILGATAAAPLPYFPVGDNPVGVVVNPKGGLVYVVDQEKPANASPFGLVLAFSTSANGVLTSIPGTIVGGTGPLGFAAGTTPSSIAEDQTGQFIYITDETTNQVYAYTALNGGRPVAITSSPFPTGLFPLNVTVDPRGEYVYVANFGSSTVTTYAINKATGALSSTAAGGSGVATGPTCVTIEGARGIYLYTSNNTDNSVSGAQLNPNTGALTAIQGTQFSAQALPTCAVAVANGEHPTQIVE